MFSIESIMMFHGSWIIEQNNLKNKTNIKEINLYTSSFVFLPLMHVMEIK
jgi:long-subunit acyl-CoA synthetase (AMP-forming)